MDLIVVLLTVLAAAICPVLGYVIGEARGRAVEGLVCGFFCGPLGVLLAMFLPPGKSKASEPARKTSSVPIHLDPLEEWESKERAKTLLEVPEHLRGRKFEE